jgi:hypothetical protein
VFVEEAVEVTEPSEEIVKESSEEIIEEVKEGEE